MTQELDPLRQRPRTEAEPPGSIFPIMFLKRRSMGFISCNLQNMYPTGSQTVWWQHPQPCSPWPSKEGPEGLLYSWAFLMLLIKKIDEERIWQELGKARRTNTGEGRSLQNKSEREARRQGGWREERSDVGTSRDPPWISDPRWRGGRSCRSSTF